MDMNFFQYCTKEFAKQNDFIQINILVKVIQQNSYIKQAYNEFTLIIKSVPFPYVLKHDKGYNGIPFKAI